MRDDQPNIRQWDYGLRAAAAENGEPAASPMRRLAAHPACFAILLGAAACAPSRGQDGAEDRSAEGRTYVVPFEVARARFAPLDPKHPDGPQISLLWGDHRTGPSAALFRFPRGYGGRFHSHSAAYHLSLLEGSMKHWDQGQREVGAPPQTAGAYWYQPAGQVHADNCLSSYCVAFVKFEGPIDASYVD
jgi:quercetin dioxygenase-like cupin family protein